MDFYRLVRASLPGAAATVSYSYLQYQYSSFYCDPDRSVIIRFAAPLVEDAVIEAEGVAYTIPAGTSQYTYVAPGTCHTVHFYRTVIVSEGGDGDGGGSGGGGSYTPPTMSAPDTCPARDERGVLNRKAIVSVFAAGWAAANSSETEHGGLIVLRNGKLTALTIPSDPIADPNFSKNCAYVINDVQSKLLPGDEIKGFWHTHLYTEGERYNCGYAARRQPRIAQTRSLGGGGPEDWLLAYSTSRPVYTVDRNSVYRLDPESSMGPSNPNVWTRSLNSCWSHNDL
jgi:hypothetical protein